jgi:hypothetical protein
MKAKEKCCPYCGGWYRPDPRADIQRCCGRPDCQRARKRQNLRRWRSLHPGHGARYQAKERAWAKAYPDYWQRYRAKHPDYVARDGQRRAAALKLARRSANETGMREAAVEKLRVLDALEKPVCSANETGFLRRVDAIEDCLRSTVAAMCSAK